MSDFTKNIMERIRERHAASEMNLEEFGQKMGYNRQSARKSAWQFLNNTADPRLSMVEKAAEALGVTLVDLFAPYGEAPQGDLATAIADLYELASLKVRSTFLDRDQAIRLVSKGTDGLLAKQPGEVVKRWNQWRVKIGQTINMSKKTGAEYADDLLEVANRLREMQKSANNLPLQ